MVTHMTKWVSSISRPAFSRTFATLWALAAASSGSAQFTRLDQMGARDLSRDGSTVIGTSLVSPRQVYWTAAGGYIEFGLEPGFGEFVGSRAVSDTGRFIVGSTTLNDTAALFRYDRVTRTVQTLGSITGLPSTIPEAVSANGNVIVGNSEDTLNFVSAAFYWTPQRGLRLIPGLGDRNYASDVSADGRVIVGGSNNANSLAQAYIWTEATGATYLDGLEPGGFSQAYAVNAAGTLVAGLWVPESNNGTRAVVWEGTRILRELPMLEGFAQMRAFDLSDDGSVVVGVANDLVNGQTAFVWTESTGTVTLRDYLTSFGLVVPDNLALTSRFNVSGDGRTFSSANGPAYVATVPVPASLAVPVLGAVFGVRRRRRSA
jgi:probable HAF family extracellular repeat protein